MAEGFTRWKGPLSWLARLGVSALLLYVLSFKVDFIAGFQAIRQADLAYLGVAFVLSYIGTISLQSAITRHSSNTFAVPQWKLDIVNLMMRFYFLFSPAAVVAVIRWARYSYLGCSRSHAGLLVLQAKFAQLFAISLFVLIPMLAYGEKLRGALGTELYFVFVVAAAAGVVAGVAAFALFVGKLRIPPALVPALIRWLPGRLRSRAAQLHMRLAHSLRDDHSISDGTAAVVLVLSLASHLTIIASQFYSARAIGLQISFTEIAFARSIVQMLVMLPITVGGLGVREIGFVGSLSLFGMAPEGAFAISMTLFGMQLAFSMIGGILELLFWLRPKLVFGG